MKYRHTLRKIGQATFDYSTMFDSLTLVQANVNLYVMNGWHAEVVTVGTGEIAVFSSPDKTHAATFELVSEDKT